MDLSQLNNTIIAPHVCVSEIAPDYPVLDIANEHASARIALHGAHVMSYQPKGHDPLLWLSKSAIFREGKAIRGGIPICWPWFGKHPDDQQPAHGFARNQFWRLGSAKENSCKETVVELVLTDSEFSRRHWPYAFELLLTITVGPCLTVSLKTTNRDQRPLRITAALHSYLHVGDIESIEIRGLAGIDYVDKLDHDKTVNQDGNVRFVAELDRVYQNTTEEIHIHDATERREIVVGKQGSRSTVLWNPWVEKSSAMGDFEAGGYRNMVCVEAANTETCELVIEPGDSHELETTISVKQHLNK